MDQTPAPTAPQPQPQPPVYIINQMPPTGRAPRSRTKRVAIACVAGVAALALLGKVEGVHDPFAGGSSGGGGIVITQPTTPAPTPAPPLSHLPPKIDPSAIIGVHEVGNQSWIDVTVTLTNDGDRPVQAATISLQQQGAPLVITDTAGWNGTPSGVTYPYTLGIGAAQTVTLRVEQWTPKQPISIVVGGNGTVNDPTMTRIACPVAVNTDNVSCSLNG